MSGQPKQTATPRNVARAVVVKKGDLFFLAEHTGEVPAGNPDGFGLYYHDCRYLNGYELRLAGTPPNALVSTAARGSVAQFELTNQKLQVDGKSIDEQTFGLSMQRVVEADKCTVHDGWTIENYDVSPHELPVSFSFGSGFEDIFEIRGLHPSRVGKQNAPEWRDGVLVLSYNGADQVNRRLEIHFDPTPDGTSDRGAKFGLRLKAGERRQIKISLQIVESREQPRNPGHVHADPERVAGNNDQHAQAWLAKYAEVQSDNGLLNAVLQRSLLDLGMLQTSLEGREFFSAGLPWYGTLFGRDSITAALQTLAYEPRIAEQTIRLLAKHQGKKTDDWRDEEPGKILHELRMGELANLNEIPQTPYYGSVDSTPLFLILVGEHANWTGDLSLFEERRNNVERALRWIDEYGMDPNTGYVSYSTKSSKGLGNQGWKDSGVSVMNADGSLATQPIALVEVQGYVYRAKLLIAQLFERSGDPDRAAQLREQAAGLKSRFNRDFWDADKNFYAIALQKDRRPADVVSSNPGQALWTGIVEKSRTHAVVDQLMSNDMFSGWGVRTLSQNERRYNPIGYHLGTVWPHDNSILAAGFRRYGFDEAAAQVLDGILAAAADFEHHRLPEVFAGFSRKEFAIPVRYPVACHPQAWAAGSVPFMLASLLGITADAFDGCLRISRPVLPKHVNELEFRRLKLGTGSVDLRFRRNRDDGTDVEVLRSSGNVRVEADPPATLKAA